MSRGNHLFLGRVVPISRISVDDIDKVGYNTCRLSRKMIHRGDTMEDNRFVKKFLYRYDQAIRILGFLSFLYVAYVLIRWVI